MSDLRIRRANRDDPLVSIVVPSFNQGRFLRQCLRSLVAQTYARVEIIVRDNLSADETPDVLQEFADRLTVVRERDRGQTDALRAGFERARGTVLGWLNADDMLMPDAVEAAVAALEGPPRADVVYGHCAFVDEGGQFLRYFDYIRPFSEEELRDYSDFIPQPSTFFRREAYEGVGGLDSRLTYAMDWDLWCRFARANARFVFLPKILSGARLHPSAKTATGGTARLLEIFRVNARHRTRLLPMVPVIYVASLLSPWARATLGPAYSPLRRVWRTQTSHWNPSKTAVNGLMASGRVVEPAFAIEIPVYRAIQGVRLSISLGGREGEVSARLEGAPSGIQGSHGGWTVFDWSLDPTRVRTHLVIDAKIESPRWAETFFRLELLFVEDGHCSVAARPSR